MKTLQNPTKYFTKLLEDMLENDKSCAIKKLKRLANNLENGGQIPAVLCSIEDFKIGE